MCCNNQAANEKLSTHHSINMSKSRRVGRTVHAGQRRYRQVRDSMSNSALAAAAGSVGADGSATKRWKLAGMYVILASCSALPSSDAAATGLDRGSSTGTSLGPRTKVTYLKCASSLANTSTQHPPTRVESKCSMNSACNVPRRLAFPSQRGPHPLWWRRERRKCQGRGKRGAVEADPHRRLRAAASRVLSCWLPLDATAAIEQLGGAKLQ